MKCQHLLLTLAAVCLLHTLALAHDTANGSTSNANVLIDSIGNGAVNWDTISRTRITIPTGEPTHTCVATASADMDNPGDTGDENQYLFVLTLNDTSPSRDNGAERMLELVDNTGVDDPDSLPVSTTRTFRVGPGSHWFYFLGTKVNNGDDDARVLDATLSVVCVDGV